LLSCGREREVGKAGGWECTVVVGERIREKGSRKEVRIDGGAKRF